MANLTLDHKVQELYDKYLPPNSRGREADNPYLD